MKGGSPEEWKVSVCGLNCVRCDIFLAGHGNEDLRREIVEWFRKERNETIRPEQVNCEGCRECLAVHWSPDCRMMLCATRRGVQYCFQCEDFPCKDVNDFGSDGVTHHERTVRNMKRAKEMGIEAWISEQKAKGQCVFCP